MARYLNKSQVLKNFRELVLPLIRKQYEQDGLIDYPARREAWNNYTDALRKEGRISAQAYDTWECPW